MILFPSIDLLSGQCVRLVQGDYNRVKHYDADPVEVARSYARQGAEWVHVVDLDAAKSGQATNTAVIRDILSAVSTLKIQVGGGVRSTEAVADWLSAGVSRVVIGTAALADWAWFEKNVKNPVYAGKIVLGLDAKDGKAASHGWTQAGEKTAVEIARAVRGWPLAAINYTDISTDGMLSGPNLASIRQVAEATDVGVVASGGVGTLSDLRALSHLPIAGVIVGRALYEARFTVAEALTAIQPNG